MATSSELSVPTPLEEKDSSDLTRPGDGETRLPQASETSNYSQYTLINGSPSGEVLLRVPRNNPDSGKDSPVTQTQEQSDITKGRDYRRNLCDRYQQLKRELEIIDVALEAVGEREETTRVPTHAGHEGETFAGGRQTSGSSKQHLSQAESSRAEENNGK